MNKRLMYGVFGLIIILVGAVAIFWLGMLHAEQNLMFKRVDPTTLARAMREDGFYSDYKQSTLIVTGKVSSVSGNQVHLQSSDSYTATCQLASNTTTAKVGSLVTLLSEGGRAERQPNGVLLQDCTSVNS